MSVRYFEPPALSASSSHTHSRLRTHPIMLTLPLLARRIIRALNMLLHLRRLQPPAPILLKRLHSRLELGLLQGKVVNGADARDTHAGVAGAAAVHEGAADAAEAVFHVVSRGDGVALAEARELVFAAGVLEG
jgi:hypothetical protein